MSRIDVGQNVELYDVARLFFGDDVPEISIEQYDDNYAVHYNDAVYEFCHNDIVSDIPKKNRQGRLLKIALYDALTRATGIVMPWGALTGVRPTKLFYEAINSGKTHAEAVELMQRVYRVSTSRADILGRIASAQNGKTHFDNAINLYVHVPYCPTRCAYCSFVSLPIDKFKEQSRAYTALLVEEIKRSIDFLNKRNIRILSVYIGGGTPTALFDKEFDDMLMAINVHGSEYTCEAGRPDSITDSKCDIMLAHGVTRVCVNPQTLNDDTLKRIGRRHTADDFFRAYDAVRSRGFDVNCDLIAGLFGENVADFCSSFDKVISLAPQNITVHSLSKKNGSEMRFAAEENDCTPQMIDYAFSHCGGYEPYYLYRQKRQACNLENVGFSVPGKESINNITTMEETVGVMACGAGAISKFVNNGKIARFANMRDVGLYISRFEEKLKEKLDFFAQLYSV